MDNKCRNCNKNGEYICSFCHVSLCVHHAYHLFIDNKETGPWYCPECAQAYELLRKISKVNG